jgi:hypothetical protein
VDKLAADEIAAVAKTIELIERNAWDDEKRLAEMIRSWLKGRL